MAKVTFLNGILSGKLGGTIYAHNKGGYYVRQFSKPTNPKTGAQVALRTSFNQALQAWHSLSPEQKAQWNNYAVTNFKAKSPVVRTVYSGFMAFCSLRATAINAQRVFRVATMTTPPATLTFEDFAPPTGEPPASSFGAGIQTKTGAPLSLTLQSATLSAANAALDLTFLLESIQIAGPLFLDPIGNEPVGFAAFMSLPQQQEGMFIHKDNLTNVGSIKPLEVGEGWVSGLTFTLRCMDLDFDIAAHKLWCVENDFVRITAFTVGKSGQTQPCGSCGVTVGA